MRTRKKIVPYSPRLKQTARTLRKNMTLGEVILWQHIRRRQIKGYQFLRQKPIGKYVVDFFCKELMLAIEVDGESHEGRQREDEERQEKLKKLGVRFLRFQDSHVKQDLANILKRIEMWIEENQS